MNLSARIAISTTRTGRNRLAHRHIEPSSLPVPLAKSMVPVYAGNVGPGTWVVEVAAGVTPVAVPPGAIAVLAGFLPPHTYVTPVRSRDASAEFLQGVPPTPIVATQARLVAGFEQGALGPGHRRGAASRLHGLLAAARRLPASTTRWHPSRRHGLTPG